MLMTIAVIWEEDQGVWAVADTRISTPGITTVVQPITDHGPKIFSLPLAIRQPSSFDIRLQTSIGYAYAGSAGPALAAHALCSAALQNLVASNGRNPSLGEIADFISIVAKRYMRNWAERWPNNWEFTALIFGWCQINARLEAYQLVPSIKTEIQVESRCVDLSAPMSIGSGAAEFRRQFQIFVDSGQDSVGRSKRLPLLAVENIVERHVREDVGGDVQLGYATSSGMRILSRSRPLNPCTSQVSTTFLGIDTRELRQVGPCFFGMWSLA
jgi:hypothetical protein